MLLLHRAQLLSILLLQTDYGRITIHNALSTNVPHFTNLQEIEEPPHLQSEIDKNPFRILIAEDEVLMIDHVQENGHDQESGPDIDPNHETG